MMVWLPWRHDAKAKPADERLEQLESKVTQSQKKTAALMARVRLAELRREAVHAEQR